MQDFRDHSAITRALRETRGFSCPVPDGSALHLLPHLVQRGARVPAILMSGCIEKYAAQLPAGIKVFEKPLHLWELRGVVIAQSPPSA